MIHILCILLGVALGLLIATAICIKHEPTERRPILWQAFWRGVFNPFGGRHE